MSGSATKAGSGRRPGFVIKASIVGAAIATVLAGCSSGTATETTNTGTKFYDKLPAAVKDAGKITMVGVLEAPPFVTKSASGQLEGLNPEIATSLGEHLGIPVEYQGIQEFGAILTGIAGGRYEGGLIFADTKEREKAAEMVSIIDTGVSFLAGPDAEPLGDKFPCASTVGVPQGSIADLFMTDANDKECAAAGQDPATIKRFAGGSDALTALASGQLDYYAGDPLENSYAIKKSDVKMTMSDKVWQTVPAGFGLNSKNTELNAVIVEALQEMIDDGSIAKVLEKWNAPTSLVLDKVGVNVFADK